MIRPESDAQAAPEIANDPAEWLDQHGDYLFAYAMRHLRDVQYAEDAVQETLLAAITARRTFQGRSSLRTWLTSILKHKIIDQRRRSARSRPSRRPVQRATAEEVEHWVDQQFTSRGKWRIEPGKWGQSPESALENEEFRAVLSRCLEKLPSSAAEALMVAERQRLGAEGISKILGTTATNIGVLLYRARSALRRCLEVHWFGRAGAGDNRHVM